MLFDHTADYTTAIVESLQKTMFESFPYWKKQLKPATGLAGLPAWS